MQPGWLDQYFHQHVDGACGQEHAAADTGAVSRRDFVKSSMVAGVAAGMATAQAAGPAEAQQAFKNPLANQ
jgi:hypothetical protein